MQRHLISRTNKRIKSRQHGRGGKRGKTSGRGTKGQNARAGRKKRPEERDIIKQIPKLRGRGKNINRSIQGKTVGVNLSALSHFAADTEVTIPSLVSEGIVAKRYGKLPRVKLLGNAKVPKLQVKGVDASSAARASIEKAGGTVVA